MAAPEGQLAELFVAALNAGDAERMAELATEDAEVQPLRGVLEDVVYHGRAGMRQWVADMHDSWAEISVELAEVQRYAIGVELAVGHMVARGHESAATTEAEVYWVVETRDTSLRRLRTFIERSAAEAALADVLANPAPIRHGFVNFEAMDPRDADAWQELGSRVWTEDIEMVEDPRWPGAGAFNGRGEVAARFREYFESLDEGRIELERIHRGAADQYVLELLMRARGVGSGVPLEQRWAWLVRIRGGRLASIRPYLDIDAALAAAGLTPS